MVNISKHNLENVRLRGNSLATQYLRLGYSAPIYLPGPGPEPGPSPEPEPEPLIPGLEGIVGIWNAYGLTNEEMKANPIWKDLSGNGNDIELKNFAWALDDGVGKYLYNFASGNWFSYNAAQEGDKLESTRIILKGGGYGFTSVIRRKPFGTVGVKFTGKVIITGLDSANGEPFYFGKFDEPVNTQILLHEGLNDIDFTIPSNWTWYGFGFRKVVSNTDITIQLLPYAYENALVFDGVDDFGINLDFPVFTKEKGYTVMALRKLIPKSTNSDIFINKSAKYSSTGTGAFRFESNIDSTANRLTVVSFGENTNLRYPELISFQLLKQYNANSINVGNVEDGKILTIADYISNDFKPLGYATPLALYSLVILDHDSTEEERALIKNYWMKYYADMIEYDEFDPTKPAYAWTVKGKTNGDLDRSTVKDLGSAGNDLQLKNFAFTEESGYNADGYLWFDGVDDQCKPLKNIQLAGHYTLILEIELTQTQSGVFVMSMRENYNYIYFLYALTPTTTNIVAFGGTGAKFDGIVALNGIVSSGVVYDKQWNSTPALFGNERPIDAPFEIGYEGDWIWAKIKLKNIAIYPGTLTKPQCQKAYDWLQQQVAPKADFGGIAIDGAPNGVYILATDNKLYTSAKWKTEYNWAAVGVAVVSDEAKFVISPEESPLDIKWGSSGTLIDGISTTTNMDTAKTDYLGNDNTDKIIAQLGAGNAPAAEYCRGVIFKNGNKGYLPGLGEWLVAYNNKAEVEVYMSLIGGTVFNTSDYYSTSTQFDGDYIWVLRWYNGEVFYAPKPHGYYVRAFAPLT